jgi:hypothetical protein
LLGCSPRIFHFAQTNGHSDDIEWLWQKINYKRRLWRLKLVLDEYKEKVKQ